MFSEHLSTPMMKGAQNARTSVLHSHSGIFSNWGVLEAVQDAKTRNVPMPGNRSDRLIGWVVVNRLFQSVSDANGMTALEISVNLVED